MTGLANVVGMRILSSLVGVALVGALLTGCIPSESPVTPSPEPSSTPVFASEEEALAAAEEAYAAYVKLADQIFIEGGIDPDRLASIATGAQLETEIEGFKEVSRLGQRSTGGTVFDGMTLQMLVPDRRSLNAVVTTYVCEDISAVDVLDATGSSVVSPSRPNRVMYELTFDLKSSDSDQLLLSLKEPWDSQC